MGRSQIKSLRFAGGLLFFILDHACIPQSTTNFLHWPGSNGGRVLSSIPALDGGLSHFDFEEGPLK
jgi:hypothetical protein